MMLGLMPRFGSAGNSRACGIALMLAAAPALAETAAFGRFSVEVPARGFQEHCVRLEAGQRMRYHFTATGEVDFNIHYHRGSAVYYPVKSEGARGRNSAYTAPHTDGYCLMWERRAEGVVHVEGAVELDTRGAR